ncbi:MAG: hypothetical protein OXD54_00405 [Candidatus Poribacteria bacterium]|nr:hypothetical protein [Candidatus Poribacteria bacterium]
MKIIAVALLLIISAFVVGCAPKLTEEQALTESQAISDFIYNSSVKSQKAWQKIQQSHNLPVNRTINTIFLPPTKKVGNQNKRLVLLNPRASLRWLRAYGFKINITSYAIMISLKKGNSHGKSYRSRPIKYSKVDDPQYLQIGHSKIRMTGFTRWNDDVIWITDQYDKIRVLTYE